MSDAPPENAPPEDGPKARAKRVDKLIGTRLAGKYKILKKIGEGGMGSVYIANQEPIDRKVAVKVLLSKLAEDEISVRRFEQEARAISRMQHPNTVTIYDFGRVEDEGQERGERLYIVMEYLKGATLTQVLRKEAALPGPRASRIMRQVCASLSDAHGAGIIHRDLKPDNIFLCELGGEKDWVKVLDFGVAKLADSEAAGTLTQTGMIFGTPKYMSPEQAEGKPIDYRADIYALGVVLYEILTGKPPFVADTPVGLLLKHITEPPPPFRDVARNRDVDARLEAIVMRALEKHPDRRQQQVTELALELEQYERAVTGPVPIPTDVGRLSGVGPVTTGRIGLPTEIVPGTLPGQPVTPSELAPPDRVPTGLGGPRGLDAPSLPWSQGGTDGVSGPWAPGLGPPSLGGSTGVATAGGYPETAPNLTAPVGPAAAPDSIGSGLSSSFSGAHPRPRPMPVGLIGFVSSAAILAAVGAYVGASSWGSTRVEPIARATVAPAPPAATRSPPEPGDEGTLPEPPSPSGGETTTAHGGRDRSGGTGRSDGSPRSDRPPREPQPPMPAKVALELASDPEGATVSLAGRQVGVTPVRIELPRSDDVLTFVFEKKGFARVERIATPARDARVEARLEPRSEPRPARPRAPRCPDGSAPPCAAPVVEPANQKVDDLK